MNKGIRFTDEFKPTAVSFSFDPCAEGCWCILVTFRGRTAHLAYEAYPLHIELGAKLMSLCKGGHEGIIVFDLEVEAENKLVWLAETIDALEKCCFKLVAYFVAATLMLNIQP